MLRRLRLRLTKTTREEVSEIARELVQLTLRLSLSRKIVESLKRSPKWPFDLGLSEVDQLERVILDLWSTCDALMRCDPGKLEEPERGQFLDEMHQIAYDRLVELGMSQNDRDELGRRSQERYPQYFEAYDIFFRENPRPDALTQGGWMVKTFMPFTRALTQHLFGKETADVEASSRIITLVNNHLVEMGHEIQNGELLTRISKGLRG